MNVKDCGVNPPLTRINQAGCFTIFQEMFSNNIGIVGGTYRVSLFQPFQVLRFLPIVSVEEEKYLLKNFNQIFLWFFKIKFSFKFFYVSKKN